MRLRNFLEENVLSIPEPVNAEEYTPEEAMDNIKAIENEIKEKYSSDDLDKTKLASKKDLMDKLRKWVDLYNEIAEKEYKSPFLGKKQKPVEVPVDITKPQPLSVQKQILGLEDENPEEEKEK